MTMARHRGGMWLLRWTLLVASVGPACAIAVYSQSAAPKSDLGEPKGATERSSQEKAPEAVATQPSTPASPEELRQAEIEADTKKLFLMAADLRAEVAKTYKDSLSLNVIKKAAEVEKLAKSLKTRMSREAAAAKHE